MRARVIAVVSLVAGAFTVAAQERASPEAAPPAVQALYERARAEGEVVLWGPQDRELDWIPEAFGHRFPGIRVVWSADRAATTRIVTEHRARRYAVDVITFSLGGLLPLSERGLLGPNDWALWTDPDSILLDGMAAALYNLVYSIVYNDTLVQPADLPKTWEDLLAPRWKGQLVASQFLLPRLLGFLALEWGEAKAAAFARALLDEQNTLITRAPREVILQRGERVIGVGEFISAALYWKSLGLPIGWAPMPIMPAAQFAVAPLARAPHPHAARLLAGWMAGPDAKALREQLRFDADVRPGAKTDLAARLARSGGRLLIEDVPNMEARAQHYAALSAIVTGRAR